MSNDIRQIFSEAVTTKRAGELVAGDEIVERDGALLKVASVEALPRGMVRLSFERGMWIMPIQPCTVRRSARVTVARSATGF